MAILQPDSTIPSATAVNTDEPATTDLNHLQQLELRLFERLDQFRGIPPEKGLWRELLDLAVGTAKTFTACGKTLTASFVHHVGLALFMRANGAGIAHVTNELLAADIRRDRAGVSAALVVLGRLRIKRSTRPNRRGAEFHALNLGGLNWPALRQRAAAKHAAAQPSLDFESPLQLLPLSEPSCGETPQLSCGETPQLKGYVRREEISDPVAAAGTPAREGSDDTDQQQQRRRQARIEGLIAAIAARARKLGMEYNEADERQGLETGEIDVDALQAHADELGEMLRTQRRHRALGPGRA